MIRKCNISCKIKLHVHISEHCIAIICTRNGHADDNATRCIGAGVE